MKRRLPKITFALALFFLICCLDLVLYDRSPWSGMLGIIDLNAFFISAFAAAAAVFGGGTLWLLLAARARGGPGRGVFGGKQGALRLLALSAGTAAVYGLLRLACLRGTVTYGYLTGYFVSLTPSVYFGLTVEKIFIVHCVCTGALVLLTAALALLARRKKTASGGPAAGAR